MRFIILFVQSYYNEKIFNCFTCFFIISHFIVSFFVDLLNTILISHSEIVVLWRAIFSE